MKALRYTPILLCMLFLACSDSEDDTFSVDLKQAYFPLEVGKFRIYQVDSILFDPQLNGTVAIDTQTYQMREEVLSMTTDVEGHETYVILRSVDMDGTWIPHQTLQASISDKTAELVEENLRYIKLVFPPDVNTRWDGNQHFDSQQLVVLKGETIEFFKSWESVITAVDIPWPETTPVYDNVVRVQLADSENLIELRRGYEVYARDIGLVEQMLWILDTQNISDTLPWQEKAEKGVIVIRRLIDHN